ncbi:MAG: hypothetical protein A3J30_03060 [Candidatus Wildermuthbacteria bacterium RIFCSPLOWO2_02_FULL_47_9c]|uniref:Lipopolysaccharide O-side chain biosynthesis protein n=2 Tax=Parcubacteria group TaxID=1794811 RepID=A0A837IKE9_9BACT|nr:MAG: Lipopolysaccharide O-side chain biosynthesis protein [Candidatus Yanofskybacteria bacterium GW2011_GWC1_48_11]KKW04087.1 MAG: Lipopolysaccharide O-side chain biosynthesis protein [Parcubacteria group bacterium GW2011_GWB1_49_12]KKW08811.1 MAG: Lipopolysaccharide O-side chain biosynthesis protein [Parcubacteria group bacterium GW2011_GWA1_49_26]KKW14292.1 MAG: Lipopolysaccharide O-side chain biosynthesis protein [Parcubacteria group bacterium GW2011_GWA2_50_10]OHA61738.1 MAG: hypothetica
MNYGIEIKNLLFTNGTVKQTIFKNVVWGSAGSMVNKLLSFVLLIYAARILGAEGYGQITFALAFASLFIILSHFGLPSIITREFARKEGGEDEFYAILCLKIILVLLTFVLIAAVSFLTISSSEVRILTVIIGSFLLMNSLIGTAYSFFHARQKMEYEAWLEGVQMLLMLSLGLFVLFRFPSPQNLSYVYLASAFLALLATYVFFERKIFRLKLKCDISIWKKYLKMSLPLALSSIFAMLYAYTDSVMLGYSDMFAETGWYNAAQRIVLLALIPMGLIASSFYPALSKLSKESGQLFQKMWDYELEIMLALAFPVVTGGIVLASTIIFFLYTADFTPAILALQFSVVTVGLNFLYRPFNDVMIISNHEGKMFWITLVGAGINVALNLILIPRYSLYGAAGATVATYSLLLIVIMVFVKKFTTLRFPLARIGLTVLTSGFSAFLMYMALQYLLLSHMHVVLLMLVGAAVYLFAFLGFRKFVVTKYFKQVYA